MPCNCKCSVALPLLDGLQCVIVVFPDHAHFMYLMLDTSLLFKNCLRRRVKKCSFITLHFKGFVAVLGPTELATAAQPFGY